MKLLMEVSTGRSNLSSELTGCSHVGIGRNHDIKVVNEDGSDFGIQLPLILCVARGNQDERGRVGSACREEEKPSPLLAPVPTCHPRAIVPS